MDVHDALPICGRHVHSDLFLQYKIFSLTYVLKEYNNWLLTQTPYLKFSSELYRILKTPPPFHNKRDYKGDTQDETPDSSTKYTNVKKIRMTV